MTLKKYLHIHPKTHLIFDFDETIAQLRIDWSTWHEGVFQIFEKSDPNFEFQGERLDELVNRYTDQFGEKMHKELDDFNRSYERKQFDGYWVNHELVAFVKADQQHHKFLYTSNASATVHPVLQELGLFDCFEKVITRDEVVLIKPNPEGMNLILDPKISKDCYLMIGDSVSDEGAAKAVGIDFFKIDHFKKD